MLPIPSTILFDVDKTLFNTPEAAKVLLDEIDVFLKQHKIDQFNAEELLNEYLETLTQMSQFHFHNLFKFIETKLKPLNVSQTSIDSLRLNLENSIKFNFLYPDVKESIKNLKDNGFRLGIFTQSNDPNWQNMKIATIKNCLTPELIFISPDKTNPNFLAKLPHEAVIIDDKPAVIQALVDFAKVNKRAWHLFLIDRHEVVESMTREKLSQEGVKTLVNLELLVKLLQ